eukprot:3786150-Prymnesium_polylepis.1
MYAWSPTRAGVAHSNSLPLKTGSDEEAYSKRATNRAPAARMSCGPPTSTPTKRSKLPGYD